jgi:hypothetical protein
MNTDYSYLNSSSSITSNFQMQLMTMMMQKLSNANSSSNSSSAAEFSDIMKLMIPMMAMQTFNMSGDSNSSSGSSLGMGSSVSSMMAPIMMSLMEKILSENVNSQLSSGASSSQVHINQFSAEKAAGGDGINANCGPTSLVMALHSLGLKVKGETSSRSDGDLIDLARKSMVKDASRDGIDKNGNRSDAEHNTFTNFNDLTRGAEAAGAKASRITPSASSIKNALLTGSKVIVSGTFVGKTPLPWTGDSGTDHNKAPGNATKHIIAITGYNQSQGKFIVDDPARKSTLLVTASQLEAFMDGNAGALAVSS